MSLSFVQAATVASGTCGTSLNWVLTDDGTLTITGTGDMTDFDVIGSPWRSNRNDITAAVLPNGITCIGDNAFFECTNMTSLNIPEGVTRIGSNSISWCKMTSLTLPSTLIEIEFGAFCHTPLTSLTIPAAVTNIGDGITDYCEALASITVEAGNEKYEGVTNCIMETAKHKLVAGCKNSVIPDGTLIIGEDAFSRITTLTSITIPNTVKTIENGAFSLCVGLTSITIPASVTEISTSAFMGCELETIVVDAGNTVYDSRNNCNAIIETATNTLFHGGIKSDITNCSPAITAIGNEAFYKSEKLCKFTIPASVTSIGDCAFSHCYGLLSITCYATTPPTSNWETSFRYVPGQARVYVYESSLAAYNAAADGWDRFRGHFYPIPDPCNDAKHGTYANSTYGASSNPVNWLLTCDGMLYIYGDGAMDQTAGVGGYPWSAYKDDITSVVVEEGITELPISGMFTGYQNITSISLPSTLTFFGQDHFNGCSSLQELIMNATNPPDMLSSNINGVSEDFKILFKTAVVAGYYANALFWIDWWDYMYVKVLSTSTPYHAAAPHATGNCGASGDNLTWDFTMTGSGNHIADYEGTLTINGSGAMAQYALEDPHAPWSDIFRNYIHHIVIAEGVTSITGSAFVLTEHVKTYILPSTLTFIGADAFWGCTNPEAEVYISANPATLTWTDGDCDDFYADIDTWDADSWYLKSTKCFVPSEYYAAYKAKWATGNPDTDVNVVFTVGLNDMNDAAGISSILEAMDGQEMPVMTITRPVPRNGFYSTLCLPFDLSAEQIAASSLASAEIREFDDIQDDGTYVNMKFSKVTAIEAGKPYIVKYNEDAANLDKMDFTNVTIEKDAPIIVNPKGYGITMQGTYVPKEVSAQESLEDGDRIFFLGANNQFFWPSANGQIKPFRCFFTWMAGSSAPKRFGMRAVIAETNTATGEDILEIHLPVIEYQKVIEDGGMYIIKDGIKYNALGQIIK